MNGYEYKIYLEENGLIESPQSIEDIANVILLSDNIEKIKKLDDAQRSFYESYGLEPLDALEDLLYDKDMYTKLAIRNAYNKEWALETFGPMYELQIKELKRNLSANIASVGYIEIKNNTGVFV